MAGAVLSAVALGIELWIRSNPTSRTPTKPGSDAPDTEGAQPSAPDLEHSATQSLALLDILLDHAPIGIALVNPAFEFIRTNAELAAMTSHPVGGHVGRRVSEVLPGLWPHIEPIYQRVRSGIVSRNVELSAKPCARDGEPKHLLVSHYPLYTAGKLVAIGVIVVDISDRQRAEAKLQETDRRKDEFLAMLAHELRNPLAPIQTAVRLLAEHDPAEHDQAKLRDIIARQVTHLGRLVDDLLDVSRISRGRIVLQKTPMDLGLALKQAIETSRPLIDERRHRLDVQLPAEPLWVDGDCARLTQVIANLLNNAAKYTDQGGTITVFAQEEKPTESFKDVVVSVRDNGRGIDPKELPQLFQMFYQANRTLDRAEGGLGIGLSLVRSLVELHDGRVEARSAGLGHGSEFIVRLPLLPVPPAPPSSPLTTAVVPNSRRSILIVDDNADAAETMAMFFRRLGYAIEVAHDGEEALRQAIARCPDIVLLDIGLPRLNGYEVCVKLRREIAPHAFIVALTGYGQPEDRLHAEQAGFDAHLVKPVSLERLQDLLRTGQASTPAAKAQPSAKSPQ